MTATHAPIGVGSSPAVCGPPCPHVPVYPLYPRHLFWVTTVAPRSWLRQLIQPPPPPEGPAFLPPPSTTPQMSPQSSLVLAPLGEKRHSWIYF